MARRAEYFVRPPRDYILVSATTVQSDTPAPAECRGVLVGQAGTLNVTMANGEDRNGLPCIQGIIPGDFAIIRAGGDAENIWVIT